MSSAASDDTVGIQNKNNRKPKEFYNLHKILFINNREKFSPSSESLITLHIEYLEKAL